MSAFGRVVRTVNRAWGVVALGSHARLRLLRRLVMSEHRAYSRSDFRSSRKVQLLACLEDVEMRRAYALMVVGVLAAIAGCGASGGVADSGTAGGGGNGGPGGATGKGGSGGTSGGSGGASAGGTDGGSQVIGPSGGMITADGVSACDPRERAVIQRRDHCVDNDSAVRIRHRVRSLRFRSIRDDLLAANCCDDFPHVDGAGRNTFYWSNASGGFDDLGGTVNGMNPHGHGLPFSSSGFAAVPAGRHAGRLW